MKKLQITPIDHNREDNGTWTIYRGVQLLIARASNTRFKAIFRRLTQPYQRELDQGGLSEEKSAEILCESLSDAILLGWKGFVMDGEEVEYSKENAKNLMLNDPDCREFVTNFSNDIENYIREDRDKVLGE